MSAKKKKKKTADLSPDKSYGVVKSIKKFN